MFLARALGFFGIFIFPKHEFASRGPPSVNGESLVPAFRASIRFIAVIRKASRVCSHQPGRRGCSISAYRFYQVYLQAFPSTSLVLPYPRYAPEGLFLTSRGIFHSDNDPKYINKRIATFPLKPRPQESTKSRIRKCHPHKPDDDPYDKLKFLFDAFATWNPAPPSNNPGGGGVVLGERLICLFPARLYECIEFSRCFIHAGSCVKGPGRSLAGPSNQRIS